VQAARTYAEDGLTPEVIAKVKIALLDMLSCAYEARDLPFAVQAIQLASWTQGGPAAVIAAPFSASPSEAAFANGTLSHGLVREDMHTGSVSHLGVVIFPALLALSHVKKASGRDFIAAAVCGYEIGAAIGRALMDNENVRLYRPTGITGPLGAAVAGSRLLGLNEDASVSALGLAANSVVGLNEWPHSGADDMFFHAGFAARNAVTCVELASMGAHGSESALDGRAGLFTVLRRAERASSVAPFSGKPEILSVFHKPAPACNYAQTPCQAALALVVEEGFQSADVASIRVKGSAAALNYPGCNHAGPFHSILQSKMSIHYGVAATLFRRSIEEANFRLQDDPEIVRLAGVTTLEEDPALTRAYPALQGAEVTVTLRNGQSKTRRMDNLIPATPDQIRERFRSACRQALGEEAATAIETSVDELEKLDDAADLSSLLSLQTERTAAA
jgi:2-methylcitrate dehydratase PrpD